MAKDIYHYGDDGLFVGKGTADECPIEKGVFHCPKNATFDAVPMHNPETHRARYQPEFWPTGVAKEQGGKWVVELLPPPAAIRHAPAPAGQHPGCLWLRFADVQCFCLACSLRALPLFGCVGCRYCCGDVCPAFQLRWIRDITT